MDLKGGIGEGAHGDRVVYGCLVEGFLHPSFSSLSLRNDYEDDCHSPLTLTVRAQKLRRYTYISSSPLPACQLPAWLSVLMAMGLAGRGMLTVVVWVLTNDIRGAVTYRDVQVPLGLSPYSLSRLQPHGESHWEGKCERDGGSVARWGGFFGMV